ncbi:helix-turn-helix domain-containing protein [Clostridium beijerinckii]|uniref:Homeodomain phBC6A51-type domain-containing protein n=1 Tax=Clostridium beijerinckii TaxID=1520 RepID=A0AAX0B818_CLOBE|nr:helix-turn-helix domain-containing protein [Clostridium beijerinckii]NRT91505.1 hypothetical protein [Clostridium beijerinckii]NYC71030.1 hypothetical protein [Clostridium beijerinckii]
MQLNEKHYKCIELLIKGLKYTEIAKKVPCSRTAIYDWLDDEDFIFALGKSRQEIKNQSNNRILAKLETYIDKIEELAFNSSSDSVKLNALQLLYEAINGKATSKVEQTVTERKDKDNDIIDLDAKYAKLPIDNAIMSDDNNVIDLDNVKKAK